MRGRAIIAAGLAAAALAAAVPALATAAPAKAPKGPTVAQAYNRAAACLTASGWSIKRDPGRRFLQAQSPRVLDEYGTRPSLSAYLYRRGEGYPGAGPVRASISTWALSYQEGRQARGCIRRATR